MLASEGTEKQLRIQLVMPHVGGLEPAVRASVPAIDRVVLVQRAGDRCGDRGHFAKYEYLALRCWVGRTHDWPAVPENEAAAVRENRGG